MCASSIAGYIIVPLCWLKLHTHSASHSVGLCNSSSSLMSPQQKQSSVRALYCRIKSYSITRDRIGRIAKLKYTIERKRPIHNAHSLTHQQTINLIWRVNEVFGYQLHFFSHLSENTCVSVSINFTPSN